jgi:hypothetical protein
MLALPFPALPFPFPVAGAPSIPTGVVPEVGVAAVAGLLAAVDPDEDEDLAEDDLPLAEPTDEESNFDDFDDEFDDDFEEEENDPDWDHGDEGDSEPPPAKGPGGKK